MQDRRPLLRLKVQMWKESIAPAFDELLEQYDFRVRFGLHTTVLDADWNRLKRVWMYADMELDEFFK